MDFKFGLGRWVKSKRETKIMGTGSRHRTGNFLKKKEIGNGKSRGVDNREGAPSIETLRGVRTRHGRTQEGHPTRKRTWKKK